MLERFRELNHPWEREHLEKSRDLVFKNTFADIETILTRCGANGTRFEFECYDISHLYNLAHFVDRGPRSRRSSCKACSACSAGSAHTRKT